MGSEESTKEESEVLLVSGPQVKRLLIENIELDRDTSQVPSTTPAVDLKLNMGWAEDDSKLIAEFLATVTQEGAEEPAFQLRCKYALFFVDEKLMNGKDLQIVGPQLIKDPLWPLFKELFVNCLMRAGLPPINLPIFAPLEE